MFKVTILLTIFSVVLATKTNIVQQRQTDSEGALGPESVPFLAPPPAPAPEPAGAGPDLDALWGPPKPYSFGYEAPGSDGRSSRSESSDGRKVTGSYTMVGADGVNRVVNYVADGDGFRASIITNEPGTERQNPSGVIMETSQPKAEEIARAFGPVAEPGPDAPRKYIGAPIPALPSVNSFQRTVSQGSAGPAFDAFSQQKQDDNSFEQQQEQQQQQSSQSLSPAPLPQAPKSFSQQIVHSIPAQLPQATKSFSQQIVNPIPAPLPQAPKPFAQRVVNSIPAFPSVNSFQRTVSQGSAGPAFDSFSQQKQDDNSFEQQEQQQQQSSQSLSPAPLPQAPKSFSQQIVHSIPAQLPQATKGFSQRVANSIPAQLPQAPKLFFRRVVNSNTKNAGIKN